MKTKEELVNIASILLNEISDYLSKKETKEFNPAQSVFDYLIILNKIPTDLDAEEKQEVKTILNTFQDLNRKEEARICLAIINFSEKYQELSDKIHHNILVSPNQVQGLNDLKQRGVKIRKEYANNIDNLKKAINSIDDHDLKDKLNCLIEGKSCDENNHITFGDVSYKLDDYYAVINNSNLEGSQKDSIMSNVTKSLTDLEEKFKESIIVGYLDQLQHSVKASIAKINDIKNPESVNNPQRKLQEEQSRLISETENICKNIHEQMQAQNEQILHNYHVQEKLDKLNELKNQLRDKIGSNDARSRNDKKYDQETQNKFAVKEAAAKNIFDTINKKLSEFKNNPISEQAAIDFVSQIRDAVEKNQEALQQHAKRKKIVPNKVAKKLNKQRDKLAEKSLTSGNRFFKNKFQNGGSQLCRDLLSTLDGFSGAVAYAINSNSNQPK